MKVNNCQIKKAKLYATHICLKALTILVFSALTLTNCTTEQSTIKPIPTLEKRGEAVQLIVDGKPFLVLGGELHNSSASTAVYMEPIFPRLKEGGLNTVLAVVAWEQIEPEEGVFDFTIVDELLDVARRNDLRLSILWFGSWKNGITSYVPAWVQKDKVRFPLIKTKSGAELNILSTFRQASLEADAKAYRALMKHLAQVDQQRTVVMMQVQNEVGLHGDTRDYHPLALRAFEDNVPNELIAYLTANNGRNLLPETQEAWDRTGNKTSGNWEEVFGKGDYTDELFMAWFYAKYLDRISADGKEEYPIPTFVNAWIVQPQDRHPGNYPSGGPQAQNLDIYRAAAPSIDLLCPDIYLPDFIAITALYTRLGNPLFIPESTAGMQGAAHAFYSFGQMKAIGYSPFGIDSRMTDPQNEPIAKAYRLMASFSDLILDHQAKGTIRGFWLKDQNPEVRSMTHTLGKYKIKAELVRGRFQPQTQGPQIGYGLVIMVADDEYIVAGQNIQVTFEPADDLSIAGLAKIQQGDFINDTWTPTRWLNGDEIQLRYDLLEAQKENQSGQGLRLRGNDPTIQRVWLLNY
jgi:hypothetical protein